MIRMTLEKAVRPVEAEEALNSVLSDLGYKVTHTYKIIKEDPDLAKWYGPKEEFIGFIYVAKKGLISRPVGIQVAFEIPYARNYTEKELSKLRQDYYDLYNSNKYKEARRILANFEDYKITAAAKSTKEEVVEEFAAYNESASLKKEKELTGLLEEISKKLKVEHELEIDEPDYLPFWTSYLKEEIGWGCPPPRSLRVLK